MFGVDNPRMYARIYLTALLYPAARRLYPYPVAFRYSMRTGSFRVYLCYRIGMLAAQRFHLAVLGMIRW